MQSAQTLWQLVARCGPAIWVVQNTRQPCAVVARKCSSPSSPAHPGRAEHAPAIRGDRQQVQLPGLCRRDDGQVDQCSALQVCAAAAPECVPAACGQCTACVSQDHKDTFRGQRSAFGRCCCGPRTRPANCGQCVACVVRCVTGQHCSPQERFGVVCVRAAAWRCRRPRNPAASLPAGFSVLCRPEAVQADASSMQTLSGAPCASAAAQLACVGVLLCDRGAQRVPRGCAAQAAEPSRCRCCMQAWASGGGHVQAARASPWEVQGWGAGARPHLRPGEPGR